MYPTSYDTPIFYIVFRGSIVMLDFSWGHSLISRDTALHHYELLDTMDCHTRPFPTVFSPEKTGRLLSDSHVTKQGQGVFTLPWLSPEYTDWLSSFFPPHAYKINPEEVEALHFPEIVLAEQHMDLYIAIEQLFDHTLRPLVHLLYGQDITEIVSIQLAKFTPEMGDNRYHLDRDSDITMTVALSDDFTGGGLEVYPDSGITGTDFIAIPKLPKGTATLFKGGTALHKGLAVESGVKHLLVFWMKI